MISKLTVIRAVSSLYALRTIRRLTIVASVILALLFVGIWALARFIDPWWWLLLVPLVIIALVFFIIRGIAVLIARSIYLPPVNTEQKQLLGNFVDKLERLLEQRGISVWFLGIISLKDLLLYRELRTIKSVLEDSRTLKSDFREIEAKLNSKN